MCLVAHVLDQPQCHGALVDVQRDGVVREVDLFEPLRDADQGDPAAQPEGFERFRRMGELAFAAVHDDEGGQFRAFSEQPAVPPRDDLGHRCKVVRALHGPDVEGAVVGFRGLAIPEHDAGRGRGGAVEVRVVEAFDVAGQHREPEVFLHRGEQGFSGGLRIRLFELLHAVLQGRQGIAGAEVEQPFLVAALGNGIGHAGHDRVDGDGRVDGPRRACESVADERNGGFEHLPFVLVEPRPHFRGVPLHDAPVLDTEEVDQTHTGIPRHRKHVHIVDAWVHDGVLR